MVLGLTTLKNPLITSVSNTNSSMCGGVHWHPPHPPPSVFHGFVGLAPLIAYSRRGATRPEARKTPDICLRIALFYRNIAIFYRYLAPKKVVFLPNFLYLCNSKVK